MEPNDTPKFEDVETEPKFEDVSVSNTVATTPATEPKFEDVGAPPKRHGFDANYIPSLQAQSKGEPFYKTEEPPQIGNTFAPGTYWADVGNRITTPIKNAASALTENYLAKSPAEAMLDPLTPGIHGPGYYGTKGIGWALNALQEHVGKHVAAGVLKSLIGDRSDIRHNAKSLTAGSMPVGQNMYGTAGVPALQDVRPTKNSPATPAEMLLRQGLTFWAGNDFALTEDEALPAINQLAADPWVFGGLMEAADQIGSLPMWLFNPGAKAALAEREALKESVRLAEVTGKEAVKKAAAIEGNLGAKVGAFQGGLQGAKDADRTGEDFGLSIAKGVVTGGIMGKVTGYLSGRVGAKSTILTERNKMVQGVGLPPETWAQFVKEADEHVAGQLAKRTALTESNHYDTALATSEGTKPGVATNRSRAAEGSYTAARADPIRNHEVFKKWEPIDTGETPTYHTVVLDHDKNLWELGVKVRPSTQTTTIVKQRKITNADFTKWREQAKVNGKSPMPAYIEPFGQDKEAYAKLADLLMPEAKEYLSTDDATAQAQLEHKEQQAFLETPKDQLEGPPTQEIRGGSGNTNTHVPQSKIAINVNDGVVAVPVADGISPRNDDSVIREGDVSTLPGGKAILIDHINKDGTVNVKTEGGKSATVQPNQIAPATDVKHLDAMERFYKPVASASPNQIKKNLLAMKKLTVARVAAATGMEPQEAAHALTEMQMAGQVKHDGRGNFYPKQYKPEIKVKGFGAPLDTLVYYDIDAVTGNGKEGILRGPDPKKKGHYLIEIGDEQSLGPITDVSTGARQGPVTPKQVALGTAIGVAPEQIYNKTKTISVSPDKMRSVIPQLWGNAKLSKLPEMYGFTKPLPPGTVVASTATQDQIAKYSRIASDAAQRGFLNRVSDAVKFKFLFNDAFLGPPELRQKAQSLFATGANLKAQTISYNEYLAKGLKGQLSTQDRGLNAILAEKATRVGNNPSPREIALGKFFAAHPELDRELQTTVEDTLTRLKQNQQWLAQNGIKSIESLEASRALGLSEEYVTNTYLRNMMQKEEFATFAREHMPNEWDNAIKYIMQHDAHRNPQVAESKMLELMDTSINDELQRAAAKDPSGNAAKNLRARVAMSEHITKIIGKVDSASMGLARSTAISESLVNRIKTWNSIMETPYWSPGPRADLGPSGGVLVPNSPVFGKAAGGRVHESLAPLVQSKQIESDTSGLLHSIGQYWKFNVVPAGGAAPWVNNVMRNWKGVVLSGGIESPADFMTFFEAVDQMVNYKRNPLKFGPAQQFLESMTNGAVSTGFASNEINKTKTVNKILDAIKRQKGTATNMWDVLNSVADTMQGSAHDIGAAYDTVDRIFKFTCYLNLKRKFLAEGYVPNDAAAMATMRINDSFPNYELVAPFVEKMRKGTIASIAPFLTSKAEDMRINAKLMQRLASNEDPALKGRLLAAATVLGGAYKLNNEIGKANGITDEDRRKAMDEVKLSSQAFRPGRFIAPWKDKEGRVQMLDSTTWDDTLMTLRIHPMDPMMAGIVRNTLVDIYGQENLPGMAIDQMSSMLGGMHPLNQGNQMPQFRPDANRLVTTLSWLAQHGAVPGFIPRLTDIVNKGNEQQNPKRSIQTEQWTPGQQTAKALGAPFAAPIGEKTTIGRNIELKQNIDQLMQEIYQDAYNNMGNDKAMQDQINVKQNAMEDYINEFENRGK